MPLHYDVESLVFSFGIFVGSLDSSSISLFFSFVMNFVFIIIFLAGRNYK